MYDINLENVKKGKLLYRILFYLALFIFIIYNLVIIIVIINQKKIDSYTTSTHTEIKSFVDDGETKYKLIYYYEVNGETYRCAKSSTTNVKPLKTNEKIYYSSSNPKKCSTKKEKNAIKFALLININPILFILIGGYNLNKINKRIRKIKKLNETGKLVKKIPYYMTDSNMVVNGTTLKKIVVDYILPNGEKVKLYGEPRYDYKYEDEDKLVDLVIDENDPENYFIDFEINRLSGNTSEDFFEGQKWN